MKEIRHFHFLGGNISQQMFIFRAAVDRYHTVINELNEQIVKMEFEIEIHKRETRVISEVIKKIGFLC